MYFFYLAEIASYRRDKPPSAISRRRLALKLSLTASIHFGERSRALSSITARHPRRHLLVGSLCAVAQRPPLTFFCARCVGYRARSFDGCTYAAQLPFTALVRALSCIRRTGSYETHRLRPIQKQLNSQFRPLRVSEKDYERRCRAVRAASASLHRETAVVCINAYMHLCVSRRAYAT